MKKTQLIILAGGIGQRFGGGIPKQFVKISGRTVLEHTLHQIDQCDLIASTIVVVHNDYIHYMEKLVERNAYKKNVSIISGGSTRQESSYFGIKACDEDTVNILFHDAIRPFVSQKILMDTIRALEVYKAVDVAIPCADTIVHIDDDDNILNIPQRKYLMRGQTPQGFDKHVIEEAYRRYLEDGNLEVTDDCGIVKHYNLAEIHVVHGDEQNIKITYQEDLYLADKLFQIHSVNTDSALDIIQVYKRLQEKVGVIFGSSRGIGENIYEKLKLNGCCVYGYSRSSKCDIRKVEDVRNAFLEVYKKEGRIDYVINTAGVLKITPLDELTADEVADYIAVNYSGSVYVTKEAIPYLEKNGGQIILFTSSSYTRGRANYSLYSSSKAAIVNFVQAVSEEVYDNGICINVMNPERTDTPMRRENFGKEPQDTLLSSESVAEATIRTLVADYTGQVVDVRKESK